MQAHLEREQTRPRSILKRGMKRLNDDHAADRDRLGHVARCMALSPRGEMVL